MDQASDLGAEPRQEPCIVDRIAQFIQRFVVLSNPNSYRLLALWVMATYLYSAFQYMGLLFIHSPEMQSGKTRLLEVLNLLVHNSLGIECSPTEAVLFRTAKGNTQLLDEADGWRDVSMIQSVLNAGFQRDGQVTRCDRNGDGGFTTKPWKTFAPRAIAGIRKDILTPTIRDRTFLVEMLRKRADERCEPMRLRRVEPEAKRLKQEIVQWVKAHEVEITQRYDAALDYPYLAHCSDRTQDIAEPLAVILEVCCRDFPERLSAMRREFADALAVAREEKNDYAVNHEVLKRTRDLIEGGVLVEQPSEIARRAALEESEVSRVLRHYGFETKSVRKDGVPRRCYEIERARIEDILRRYENSV